MEAERYRRLRDLLLQLAHPPRRKVQYSDQLILLVFLWAVLHDRPVSWACQERHWPQDLRPGALPSQATLSRRLRTLGLLQLLERLLQVLLDCFAWGLVKMIDAKPLAVGPCSKDKDARWGYAAGTKARGYKIHGLACGLVLRHWQLTSMKEHETQVAPGLLAKLKDSGGYVCGDNAYDSNDLHRACAAANHQLVAPPQPVNAGKRDPRHNCPQRLRALDLCEDPLAACGRRDSFGKELMRRRSDIERSFAHLTLGGLNLPPFVRRPHRVALWVAGKLIIRLDRQAQIQGVTA